MTLHHAHSGTIKIVISFPALDRLVDMLNQDKIDKETIIKAASDLNTTGNELQKAVDENKPQ